MREGDGFSDFGDLDLIFRVTQKRVIIFFWKSYPILMTLTLFQGNRSTLSFQSLPKIVLVHELVDFSLYHCDTIKNRRHACRLNLWLRA